MRWPSSQEYNEAIQNPAAAFADPELARGQPALGLLGLPKTIQGNFAAVYRVATANGDFAVRCFLREQPERQDRYAAIDAHLRAARVPALVEFDYQENGLRVGGSTFPMLKMEWLKATSLDRYIEANLGSREKLEGLVREFTGLLGSLAASQIAHGDLQHGNLIVEEYAGVPHLRLIDYDGMWVPALSGRQAIELGHPNYQHPARRADQFGPYLDAFSAWSILTSLLLLLADPGFWPRLHRGDEQLLFAKHDYQEPWDSQAMDVAQSVLGDGALSEFGRRLVDFSLALDIASFAPPPVPSTLPGPAATGSAPWWKPTPPVVPGGGAPSEPWWIDRTPLRFEPDFLAERVVSLLALLLGGVAIALVDVSLAIPIAFAALVAAIATLAVAYVMRPEVAAKRASASVEAAAREELGRAEVEWARSKEAQLHATAAERARAEQADKELAAVKSAEQAKLRSLDAELGTSLATLRQQSAATTMAESDELNQALAVLRQRYIDESLAACFIYAANISGIGSTLAQRLASDGFRSAADVVDWRYSSGYYQRTEVELVHASGRQVHVEGMGEAKCQGLVAWADRLRERATARAPSSLPPAEVQRIRAKYASRQASLHQSGQEAQANHAKHTIAVKEVSRDRLAQRADAVRLARQALAQAIAPYEAPSAQAERAVGERRVAHGRARRDLDRYALIRPSVYLRLVTATASFREPGASDSAQG